VVLFFEHIYSIWFGVFAKSDLWVLSLADSTLGFISHMLITFSYFFTCVIRFCWSLNILARYFSNFGYVLPTLGLVLLACLFVEWLEWTIPVKLATVWSLQYCSSEGTALDKGTDPLEWDGFQKGYHWCLFLIPLKVFFSFGIIFSCETLLIADWLLYWFW
jgi:hypothetical protein